LRIGTCGSPFGTGGTPFGTGGTPFGTRGIPLGTGGIPLVTEGIVPEPGIGGIVDGTDGILSELIVFSTSTAIEIDSSFFAY